MTRSGATWSSRRGTARAVVCLVPCPKARASSTNVRHYVLTTGMDEELLRFITARIPGLWQDVTDERLRRAHRGRPVADSDRASGTAASRSSRKDVREPSAVLGSRTEGTRRCARRRIRMPKDKPMPKQNLLEDLTNLPSMEDVPPTPEENALIDHWLATGDSSWRNQVGEARPGEPAADRAAGTGDGQEPGADDAGAGGERARRGLGRGGHVVRPGSVVGSDLPKGLRR